MVGASLYGVRAESPRRESMARAHPLGNATPAQTRSTMIRTLRAAGQSMPEIAAAMRCSLRTLRNDLLTPPVSVMGDRDDD